MLANGKVQTEIYGSVGLTNGTDWSSGSYGGYHIKANNLVNNIEMTVGGLGFGFCGAYLNSDGTNIYLHGSEDGIGQACQATASTCNLNANLASTGNCTALDTSTFHLAALGRNSTTNYGGQAVSASTYGSGVVLTGASNDSVHFGPTETTDLPSTITGL